jgi:hypothetical protein
VILEGSAFQAVPFHEVAEPLRKWATGWSGTKVIEDLVHVAKATKNSNEATNVIDRVAASSVGISAFVAIRACRPPVPSNTEPHTGEGGHCDGGHWAILSLQLCWFYRPMLYSWPAPRAEKHDWHQLCLCHLQRQLHDQ